MSKKIAINGFGRIGRTIFRAWLKREIKDLEIVAVNNIVKGDPEKAIKDFLHLLKHDTVHGLGPFEKMKIALEKTGDKLYLKVGGHSVRFFTESEPSKVDWSSENVELVVDSTGFFKGKQALGQHIRGTVKKVIMSAPGDDLDATFVVGVNDDQYDSSIHHIVSNASCTTNCLAPVLKVLHEKFKIKDGMLTTVHSITGDQRVIDTDHNDLRRARGAYQSMIPTSTGAAKAIGLVLPELKGKLDGYAMRVPTPNVSVVDVTLNMETDVTKEEINEALKEASNGSLKGVLDYSVEELVSVDYNGNQASATVDSLLTQIVNKRLVKIIAWYDNETGYSNRVLDLALIMLK